MVTLIIPFLIPEISLDFDAVCEKEVNAQNINTTVKKILIVVFI
jgi:hypothetical protein